MAVVQKRCQEGTFPWLPCFPCKSGLSRGWMPSWHGVPAAQFLPPNRVHFHVPAMAENACI